MATQIFRLGDQDKPEVAEMQRILNHVGLYPFAIDGDFGFGTYRALIAFQTQNGITPDGVLGPNTMEALRKVKIEPPKDLYSAKNIINAMKKKKYTIREEQYRLNMVGVRMDNVYDNRFSDKLVIFWKNEKKDWEKREYKWTTMPGTYGQGVFNPITVLGITGTAALKEAQYLDTWTFVDSYGGWLNYPYFWQTKNVTVYRDGNKNETLELNNPQQVGLFGINLHRMSNNGIDSDTVNSTWASWSIGCQGAPEPVFADIVALARVSAKFHGNIFDYTLLNKSDL
jgi:peptidoglycan hydrolase-like protein with peptidoglycan-binding domain